MAQLLATLFACKLLTCALWSGISLGEYLLSLHCKLCWCVCARRASFSSVLPQKAKRQQCLSHARVRSLSPLPVSQRFFPRSSFCASREISGKSPVTASDSQIHDHLPPQIGGKYFLFVVSDLSEASALLWLCCIYGTWPDHSIFLLVYWIIPCSWTFLVVHVWLFHWTWMHVCIYTPLYLISDMNIYQYVFIVYIEWIYNDEIHLVYCLFYRMITCSAAPTFGARLAIAIKHNS